MAGEGWTWCPSGSRGSTPQPRPACDPRGPPMSAARRDRSSRRRVHPDIRLREAGSKSAALLGRTGPGAGRRCCRLRARPRAALGCGAASARQRELGSCAFGLHRSASPGGDQSDQDVHAGSSGRRQTRSASEQRRRAHLRIPALRRYLPPQPGTRLAQRVLVRAAGRCQPGTQDIERGHLADRGRQPDMCEATAEINRQLLLGLAERADRVRRVCRVVRGHRSALGLVGVQQLGSDPTAEHSGELPAQVVPVMDGGVHSRAAAWREPVGGVADEERAVLASRRDDLPCAPAGRAGRPARPAVTVDEATDLLWLLASFDSFDQLYTGRGLSVDEVARVLITTAELSLCR